MAKLYGRQLDDVLTAWQADPSTDVNHLLPELTDRWVKRRRLECGGADMGGVHRQAWPAAPWTLTDIARRVETDPDNYPGRHATPYEKAFYTVSKVIAKLDKIGLF